MNWDLLINWFSSMASSVGTAWKWLITPLHFWQGLDLAPLYLFGISGLLALVGVLLVKWVASWVTG